MLTLIEKRQAVRDSLTAVLQQTIPDVELVIGVWADRATWTARSATATAQQLAAARQTIDAFDISDAAQAIRTNLANRAVAKALTTDDHDPLWKAYRAGFDAARDSDNVLRAWIMSFKVAVAQSSSLNDLKTRVAALSNLPQLNKADVFQAIGNRLDDGSVD